ncbi:MAG: S46 family peptidase [bacterium]
MCPSCACTRATSPRKPRTIFPWSPAGTRAGDLTFVTGHPGRTSRLKTVAELESFRGGGLLRRLLWLSELRGALAEYAHRGAEQARHSKTWLFYVENGLKAYRGEAQALFEPALLEAKRAAEKALRARVAADPKAKDAIGAWDAIAKAVQRGEALQVRYDLIERGRGFQSDLFGHARTLVRLAAEKAKPNEERLREYTDGNLPAVEAELLSAAPLYDEFEIFKLGWTLTRLREQLGPDDALVKQVLGKETPDAVAARLVKGSGLKDPAARKALLEGGAAAIAASQDPFIALAKAIDAEARAVRKTYEDEVEAPIRKSHELIARARFAVEGTGRYPDATFTLRLSYGAVKGWPEGGREVEPYTTIGGAFTRHTGAEPFALPASWLSKKDKLDLATPFNLVTTNDIIGGNSGSPVIDREARIVGLIFDGNIHSLGGDHGFDARLNRAVAVDSRAILHALDRVYGATALVKELSGR